MSNCCGDKKKTGGMKYSPGKIDSFILITILITILLIAGGAIWAVKSSNSTNSVQTIETPSVSLKLLETSYDWGDIPINGGNVEKSFEIINTGSSYLELANFVTSCMCTTVIITTQAEESPKFGMHTKSNWKGIVGPGESAQIKVIFDPAFHGPQGKGNITRMVQFNTNASGHRQIELRLTGKVI